MVNRKEMLKDFISKGRRREVYRDTSYMQKLCTETKHVKYNNYIVSHLLSSSHWYYCYSAIVLKLILFALCTYTGLNSHYLPPPIP